MKMSHRLCSISIIFISQISFAATYAVPTQYTTIQAAIDSATHGDTVIVSPGHYYEHVDLKGHGLVLRSVDPASAEVVANTIIDGSGTGTVLLA